MTAADHAIADEVLLERYSNRGDEVAFSQIVTRYTDAIYSTCLRVLNNRAQAQEATQETFLRLIRRPRAVSRSLGGWLHRTATHIAIDMIRRDRSRRQRELDYATEEPRHASRWDELSPLIDEALLDLPEDARVLLIDHFILGKAQREIVAERGTSPATVSRRMQAALESLRAALRKRGVAVGAAALGTLLLQNTVEAAPAALCHELGKMAMVSGAKAGLSTGVAVAIKVAAWSTVALVAVVAMGVWLMPAMLRQFTPESVQGLESPSGQRQPGARRRGEAIRFVTVPNTTQSLDSQTIRLFQDPATCNGKTMACVFADGHTLEMKPEEARRLIEKQTGQTVESLAAQGSRPLGPP